MRADVRDPPEPALAKAGERLPKELAARGIDTMSEANRYLAEHYRGAFNEEFAVAATEPGTAFVPFIGPGLADVLCEHHERTVSRDNCVSFEGKRLQIPAPDPSLPLHQGAGTGAPLPRRAHGGVPRTAQAGRVRVRRRPGGRRRAHRAGLCRSGSLNVPLCAALALGWLHRRVGERDIRLENSLCPDAFALPPSAAARYAPRGCGWLGLATPMDTIAREVPRIGESVPVRDRSASAKRSTVSPLTHPRQSGQFMCYKTGQFYLLLTHHLGSTIHYGTRVFNIILNQDETC